MTLMGQSGLAPAEVFKKEALDKASKQFQKMEIQRGEWVHESDLSNYFKECSYYAGKFIREAVYPIIKNRHHIVYRNGRDKDGNEVEIDGEVYAVAKNAVVALVEQVRQLVA